MSCERCDFAGVREGMCDRCGDRGRHETMERGGPVAVQTAPKWPDDVYRIVSIQGIVGMEDFPAPFFTADGSYVRGVIFNYDRIIESALG